MKTTMVVAAALLASQVALGEELPVVVEENQTVVQVNGMVCSFCAYGAEKALSDLDCLDAADFGNGVFVDIDTHRIDAASRTGRRDQQPGDRRSRGWMSVMASKARRIERADATALLPVVVSGNAGPPQRFDPLWSVRSAKP